MKIAHELAKKTAKVYREESFTELKVHFSSKFYTGEQQERVTRHYSPTLRLVKKGDPDALKRQETPDIRHKNCVDKAIEDAVVKFSVEHPLFGQQKVAIKLTEALGIDISAGGVRSG